MDKNKYILLFESCQLTKGFGRTLLADMQRNKIEFLDNELYAIFNSRNRSETISEICAGYEEERKEIVLDYFSFLLDNEYAFLCEKEEVAFFPLLNKSWDHPAVISNCIIDFDKVPESLEPYKKVIAELDELGCENIQVRDFTGLPFDFLETFLKLFNHSVLYRVELLLKYNGDDLQRYNELVQKFERVNELIVHSCELDVATQKETAQQVYLTSQVVSGKSCCGIVSPRYFNLDQDHILESRNYNSCLNRKISIDAEGIIKNCPSMLSGFGHITDVSIKEIVKQEQFTSVWSITKDMIDDCKVCEFRHVCTDCRAYLGNDHSLKKPAKCNYNPYGMTWGDAAAVHN